MFRGICVKFMRDYFQTLPRTIPLRELMGIGKLLLRTILLSKDASTSTVAFAIFTRIVSGRMWTPSELLLPSALKGDQLTSHAKGLKMTKRDIQDLFEMLGLEFDDDGRLKLRGFFVEEDEEADESEFLDVDQGGKKGDDLASREKSSAETYFLSKLGHIVRILLLDAHMSETMEEDVILFLISISSRLLLDMHWRDISHDYSLEFLSHSLA